MDNINLWKNLGTVLVIAGIVLIAYAGYMFRLYNLYAFILLKRGGQAKAAARSPGKAKKDKITTKKPEKEKAAAIYGQEEKSPHAVAGEAPDGPSGRGDGGSGETAPLEEPAEKGTVLLETVPEAVSVQADGEPVWFEPSEGFYIKKSIMIIHTEKAISEKGEIL